MTTTTTPDTAQDTPASLVLDTLPCGATLVIEPMRGVSSVATTWLLPAGDAFDDDDRLGAAPMMAELLLRGAGDMGSRAQADAFDRSGATRSVSNGRVFMRIGATTVGERLAEVLGLIAQTVRRPRLDEPSIAPARELCLQSLASLADDPQHRAGLAARARHRRGPLNRSGYGDEKGLAAIDRAYLAARWPQLAVPEGSIIAIAGAVEPDAARETAAAVTEGWSGASPWFEHGPEAPRGYAHEDDDTEQVQIIVVHDGPREADSSSVMEKLVASVLSGGMSSRLFTEVREKRGLCYSVNAGYAGERDGGVVSAYVGTTPERAQEAIDVLFGELSAIGREKPIEADELARAKAGMKSRLVFNGESSGARASALASDVYRVGRPRALDELSRAIDAVTLDGLNAYASGREMGRVTIQTLGKTGVKPPA